MLISSVDYNLLRPLQALLEERSVSRAAERMKVSQPTMSTALRRLRAHFDDRLLLRSGGGYELTPLADRLNAVLPSALNEVERVLQLESRFDPTTSTRSFVIAGVDFAIARIAPALNTILQEEAPHIQFEFPAADVRMVTGAPDTLRAIDGLILPHGYFANQPHLDLITDSWVCIVDGGSGLGESPSAEELLSRPWVHTLAARDDMTPARRQLQIRGIDVMVAAVTPHFLVIPSLIAGTDRVALLPRTLAQRVIDGGAFLRIVESPFPLEPIRDALWWHRDRERDDEHIWLRGVMARVRDVVI